MFHNSSRSPFQIATNVSMIASIELNASETPVAMNESVFQIVSAIAHITASIYIITVSPCSARRAFNLSNRGQMIADILSTASFVIS